MSDISVFFRLAWKYIWKQKIILVFSFLYFLSIYIDVTPKQPDLQMVCLYAMLGLVSLAIMVISQTGITYVAYKTAISEVVTFLETYQVARKLFWRVVALHALTILVFSPCICSTLAASYLVYEKSSQISGVFNIYFFAAESFSIISALSAFIIIGFIAHDWGIRKSVKYAWTIFTEHFGVLALAGIILMIMGLFANAIINISSTIIESGFDLHALGTIKYPDFLLTMKDRPLLHLTMSAVSIVWVPFTDYVFVLAYLKYSGVKEKELVKPLYAIAE